MRKYENYRTTLVLKLRKIYHFFARALKVLPNQANIIYVLMNISEKQLLHLLDNMVLDNISKNYITRFDFLEDIEVMAIIKFW